VAKLNGALRGDAEPCGCCRGGAATPTGASVLWGGVAVSLAPASRRRHPGRQPTRPWLRCAGGAVRPAGVPDRTRRPAGAARARCRVGRWRIHAQARPATTRPARHRLAAAQRDGMGLDRCGDDRGSPGRCGTPSAWCCWCWGWALSAGWCEGCCASNRHGSGPRPSDGADRQPWSGTATQPPPRRLAWRSRQRREAPPCRLRREDAGAIRQAHRAFPDLGEVAISCWPFSAATLRADRGAVRLALHQNRPGRPAPATR
jgi:hypothetical protein